MRSPTPLACACRHYPLLRPMCWPLWQRKEAVMRAFEYASPASTQQALQLLGNSWNDAAPLAGGTDLLSLMKDDIVAPRRLVNIKELPELRGIKASKQGLRIGALTTIQELADDAKIRQAYPVIAHTANDIAGPQI